MRIARFAAAALTVAALAVPALPAQAVTVPVPSVVHVDTIANPDAPASAAPTLNYVTAAAFAVVNARGLEAIQYRVKELPSTITDTATATLSEPAVFEFAPPSVMPAVPSLPTHYVQRLTNGDWVNIASLTVIR